MNIAIIEDEKIARTHLQQLIEELDGQITVVKTLDSVSSAVDYLGVDKSIDLLFMDIELGDGQSFEIVEQLNLEIPIIFTTAYENYALKAFKNLSVDYLLKPIKKEELWEALNKYKKHYKENNSLLEPLTQLQIQLTEKFKTRFLARLGTRMVSVPVETIAFFYTRERLQYIKTLNGKELLLDKTLDEIESGLDPSKFFRANRQFILSYPSIKKTQAWLNGKLKVGIEPVPYEEIIISRLRAADFKKWLGE